MDDLHLLETCCAIGFDNSPRSGETGLAILQIDPDEWRKLIESGHLPAAQCEEQWFGLEPIPPGLILVFSVDRVSDLIDLQDGVDALQPCLREAFIGEYDEVSGLTLLSKTDLYTLLLRHRETFQSHSQDASVRPLTSYDWFQPCALAYLENRGDYSGCCYLCEDEKWEAYYKNWPYDHPVCLDPGCRSHFCWKLDGRIMLYIQTDSTRVGSVLMFPRLD